MSDSERRTFFRYRLLEEKYATLKFGKSVIFDARLQDVSASGMCLQILLDSNSETITISEKDDCVIIVRSSGKSPDPIKGTITRNAIVDNSRWLGIKFEKELEPTCLSLVRSNYTSSFELAKLDKSIVQGEALQIKTCASNYFITTVVIILPLISAILGLSLQKAINPPTALWSFFSLFLVYTMSVFSSLEKSRAIYKRESFIAALDTYLIRGISPPDYRGWINMKYNFAECTSRRTAGACPRKTKDGIVTICKYEGERLSKLNSYKKVVHSILDSFISLTSVFYLAIYLIILSVIIYSLINFFVQPTNIINEISIVLYSLFGWALGFSIGRNHKFLFGLLFLSSIVFFILLNKSTGIVNQNTTYFSLEYISIVFFVVSIGFIIGSIGNIWVGQLFLLRKKQYSFESQFYMWIQMLENCQFMPDYIIEKENKNNAIVEWMLFGTTRKSAALTYDE